MPTLLHPNDDSLHRSRACPSCLAHRDTLGSRGGIGACGSGLPSSLEQLPLPFQKSRSVDQASTPFSRDAEFEVLLGRVRAGSEQAIQELVDTYGDHVLRVVRRRLNKSLRPKFDSLDFVQSMWASFFEHRSQIAEFDSPEALTRYLSRIVSNKVIEQCRRYLQTEKHNVNRERSLDGTESAESLQPPSPRSTPSEVVQAKEQWQRLLENQPPHYQRMLWLRAEGTTFAEIAAELGVDEKTVRRVLQRISRRVEE